MGASLTGQEAPHVRHDYMNVEGSFLGALYPIEHFSAPLPLCLNTVVRTLSFTGRVNSHAYFSKKIHRSTP